MSRTRARVVEVSAAEVAAPGGTLPSVLEAFFARRGWTPWGFQRQAWAALAAGRSGLIHVPTGAGKTYAAFMGALAEVVRAGDAGGAGLRIVYVTPLRAVARDIELALRLPIEEAGLGLRVESRTGDTGSSLRARQRDRLPEVLVTTPESLTLMLTWPDAPARLGGVVAVIVDEWHELLSSKRGTQVELALARLRRFSPGMRTWALSATLANLAEAARTAVGTGRTSGEDAPVVVSADMPRPVEIETLLPSSMEAMPWAGHLGLSLLPGVVGWLESVAGLGRVPGGAGGADAAMAGGAGLRSLSTLAPPPTGGTTLVFVNTRSQCERWFHALMAVRPEWEAFSAIHHGSIDRAARERVETGLKDGSVRLVVATSSLDLGVDFAPVDRVVQIGSPKGVARLLQRAGRSGHRPGESARILCVPTHALEILEVAAVRSAIAAGEIEARRPERAPVDVLAQHLVTCALGGGFDADEMYEEVRTAHAFADLTREAFDWALSLVCEGGGTLRAYPEFRKVERGDDGRYGVRQARVAQLHRLNVGTIVGEATIDIAFANGRRLGSIEENFIAGLRPGQRFFFAGRTLEFVRMREMTAVVHPARGKTNLTPIWGGTRLPISESVSGAMRRMIGRARELVAGGADTRHRPGAASVGLGGPGPAAPALAGEECSAELKSVLPVMEIQGRLSHLPSEQELLVEVLESREGAHAFVFPFEGRLVHAGLAAVLALRLARARPASLTIAANDYGFGLLGERGFPFEDLISPAIFDPAGVVGDSVEALNLGELGKRQFREIARVAGLVFQSYPGARKGARQVQASSSLIYDVYRDFDPENPLMIQARREVLERQFEEGRLGRTMAHLAGSRLVVRRVERPTPLSLPLVLEREAGHLSTRSLLERVERIVASWGEGPTARRGGEATRRRGGEAERS